VIDSPREAAVSFLETHEAEFQHQVQWFLLVRVVAAMTCLGILLIYEEGQPRRFTAAYVILIVAVAQTAGHLLAVQKRVDSLDRWVIAAVVLDLFFETSLVYLTGGIYNLGFALLIFGTILSAVLLLSERAGLLVASGATVALACTALLYWGAANPASWGSQHSRVFLPWVPVELYGAAVDLRWGRVTANLIGAGLAFHGVAVIAARLPYRVSESRILFDEILERMGEGVVAIDRRGTILLANAEVRRLLNWHHLPSMAGSRFERVLRRSEDRAVLELLARGDDAEAELELLIRGKGPVSVFVRTTVLRDGEGRVRGVIGIFHDRSVHRQLEETERRLSRHADTEAMALGIAHEIRNPLGSIRGAVQELAEHTLDDPADQRLAQIVLRESDRLDRILQQFLDFARMRPPLGQRVKLGDVVEEIVLLLQQRKESSGVEITSTQTCSAYVEVDADQLRQALLNIGLNALQAIGAEGRLRFEILATELQQRTPTTSGSVVEVQPAVEIRIENDGPPIPEEERDQIFVPFFTTKQGGLGLGMAITQKILRSHGGDVGLAKSEDLGGPSFRLTLPTAAEEAGSEEAPALS
jgi:two-component system sensor histidine kinase PilS (NtrC family)